MPKNSISYLCSNCEATYPRWVGKCGQCGEFGTVDQNGVTIASGSSSRGSSVGIKGDLTAANVVRKARRVADIESTTHRHADTGIGELNRVLGGGLVKGQAVLLAGEPGVGKSTLLLELAQNFASKEKNVLYISGEESAEQIALRAQRTGASANSLFIADETDLSVCLGHIEEVEPELIIIDSVQTIASPSVEGRAGGIAQVQEVSAVLTRVAKATHIPIIMIAQVNKDGNIAGPKTLEHLVDTVLFFEGDRNTPLRLLRTIKNRFGNADEVAAFEQTESGIKEVADPSGLFLSSRDEPVSGNCITVTMEGRRAILAEIQALVSPTNAPNPRRGVTGLDYARSSMLVAVTEKHGRVKLFDKDSYLATIAGMKIVEPAADLAVCLALASAAYDIPIPNDMAALGEVTLSGDIRSMPGILQRVAEAERLGIKKIFIPKGQKEKLPKNSKIVAIEIDHISKAFAALKALN